MKQFQTAFYDDVNNERLGNRWASDSKVKRGFDVVVASLLLFMLVPTMILIAAATRLSSRGPVFYSQVRIGRNGRLFRCLKFRTMYTDADARLAAILAAEDSLRLEWLLARKLKNDPRIVRGIGTILRKSSLDELPQLINVIRGEMSLVGPRPIVEEEMTYYGVRQSVYLSVRPGLTGLWQASARSDCTYEERVALDCDYVMQATLLNDVRIILTTARRVLRFNGNGAY